MLFPWSCSINHHWPQSGVMQWKVLWRLSAQRTPISFNRSTTRCSRFISLTTYREENLSKWRDVLLHRGVLVHWWLLYNHRVDIWVVVQCWFQSFVTNNVYTSDVNNDETEGLSAWRSIRNKWCNRILRCFWSRQLTLPLWDRLERLWNLPGSATVASLVHERSSDIPHWSCIRFRIQCKSWPAPNRYYVANK